MKFLSKLTLFISVLGLSCGAFGMEEFEQRSFLKDAFGSLSFGSATVAVKAAMENNASTLVEKTAEVVADTVPVVVQEASKLTQLWDTVGNTFSNSLQWLGETRPLEWFGETVPGQWLDENPKRNLAIVLGGLGATALIGYWIISNRSGKPVKKKKLFKGKNLQAQNEQQKKQEKKQETLSVSEASIAVETVAKALDDERNRKEAARLYKNKSNKVRAWKTFLKTASITEVEYEAWFATQK